MPEFPPQNPLWGYVLGGAVAIVMFWVPMAWGIWDFGLSLVGR